MSSIGREIEIEKGRTKSKAEMNFIEKQKKSNGISVIKLKKIYY